LPYELRPYSLIDDNKHQGNLEASQALPHAVGLKKQVHPDVTGN
jgi:hypothetical protein